MRRGARSPFRRHCTWFALVLGAAVSGGCGAADADERPNVVFVCIDSLRADRTGALGGPPGTTPNLDALGSRGTVFTAAYSTAPWAAPSVASMMTGRLPRSHGLSRSSDTLPGAARTLAEVLGEAGYETAGFVSDFRVAASRGFSQGFAEFSQREAGDEEHVSTEGVLEQARTWLFGREDAGRPFFLFVHFADPRPSFQVHGKGFEVPAGVGLQGGEGLGYLQVMTEDMSPDELAVVHALYEGEVRHADAGLGALVAALEEAGKAEDTIFVVAGTHGIELMDRDWIGEAHGLHDELLRVPLVVTRPDRRGAGPINAPVSTASVMPTVLQLVGVGRGELGLDAPSLAQWLEGARAPTPPVRFEVDWEPPIGGERVRTARKVGVRKGRHKLIRDVVSGELALFDLAADPREQRDLALEDPELARSLAAECELTAPTRP